MAEVKYGSVVKISINKDGIERIRTVAFSDEHVESCDNISKESPLWKLLFGKEVGFSGDYKVGANALTATILSIE